MKQLHLTAKLLKVIGAALYLYHGFTVQQSS